MSTIANQFAELLRNDGQVFETDDGIGFTELAFRMDATETFSARSYQLGDEHEYVDGTMSGYVSGDPIRYEFPDGSAVVLAGDAWDHEGETRYSWAGA